MVLKSDLGAQTTPTFLQKSRAWAAQKSELQFVVMIVMILVTPKAVAYCICQQIGVH